MTPILGNSLFPKDHLMVLLDGKVIGRIGIEIATQFVAKLRYLKVKKQKGVKTKEKKKSQSLSKQSKKKKQKKTCQRCHQL